MPMMPMAPPMGAGPAMDPMGAPPMGAPPLSLGMDAPPAPAGGSPASLAAMLLGPLAAAQEAEQAALEEQQAGQVASLVAALRQPNAAGMMAMSEPGPVPGEPGLL